eukprot:922994_1
MHHYTNLMILETTHTIQKRFQCAKNLNHFYFDQQLFIIHSHRFQQRILSDHQNNWNEYSFVNVSPKIEKPMLCNDMELAPIHSTLKQIIMYKGSPSASILPASFACGANISYPYLSKST